MFLKVEEEYCLPDNSHERHRSHHYHGIHNILWLNNCDCFNGEACILSENEGTSSARKKKKEKEKLPVTDKEKLLAKFGKKSTHCKPIQFKPSPTKRGFTPVYQPRFPLLEEITVDVPQDDNTMVTDVVTVQVQEDDSTMVTKMLKVQVPEEDNTTVTKAITIVAAVKESKRKYMLVLH
jgi:hypothetical protein